MRIMGMSKEFVSNVFLFVVFFVLGFVGGMMVMTIASSPSLNVNTQGLNHFAAAEAGYAGKIV
jgi:hypothetical protein